MADFPVWDRGGYARKSNTGAAAIALQVVCSRVNITHTPYISAHSGGGGSVPRRVVLLPFVLHKQACVTCVVTVTTTITLLTIIYRSISSCAACPDNPSNESAAA